MTVSNIGAPAPTTPIKIPEAAEPKGRDLTPDGDADDATAPAATLPPGQGTLIDKKA